MSRTTFFTVADRRYELFVVPYIASVLTHNADARVEICLEDADSFSSRNEHQLEILADAFGEDRFLLRDTTTTGVPPNSVRFLEEPRVITEFTYIADIDILILEAVSDVHIDRMNRLGLPYSNHVRAGRRALSGLHFTRSDAYYPVTPPKDVDMRRDEALLYSLVTARGWGTPPEGLLRPGVHGYHLSANRSPLPRMVDGRYTVHWGLYKSKVQFKAYRRLLGSSVWQALFPHFDSRYRLLLGLLDVGLARRYWRHRPVRDRQVESLLSNLDLVRSIIAMQG